MSRIDQALAKGIPEAVAAEAEPTTDNPWNLSQADALPSVPLSSETAEAIADEPAAVARVMPNADDPSVADLSHRLGRSEAAEKVVGTQLPPNVVEEYRRLAALLHHTQVERNSQVLMITSAVAGEGKTLTATNLALTLSGSYGRSVLLIDADLRRPSLHQMFHVSNVSGLSDLLNVGTTATPALTALTPRLTLLTAGRPDPDPMEALTSDRMKQLIEEARAGFDWVIIDTPPVGLLTDASLLAKMVDLALLVVRAESTPFEQVQRAAEAVGRHRVTGVVLNRVSKAAMGEGSHYSEYYSSYSTPRES